AAHQPQDAAARLRARVRRPLVHLAYPDAAAGLAGTAGPASGHRRRAPGGLRQPLGVRGRLQAGVRRDSGTSPDLLTGPWHYQRLRASSAQPVTSPAPPSSTRSPTSVVAQPVKWPKHWWVSLATTSM